MGSQSWQCGKEEVWARELRGGDTPGIWAGGPEGSEIMKWSQGECVIMPAGSEGDWNQEKLLNG